MGTPPAGAVFAMGVILATYKDPKSMPDTSKDPIYPPLQGFPEGRTKREAIVTEEEMMASGLKPELRDYCAHYYIVWKKCIQEYPITYMWHCSGLRHDHHSCTVKDNRMRLMEYERERRLLKREQSSD